MSVFVSIRKRQFEQVKAAVPVILNALKAIVLDSDDEDADLGDIFHKANCIADSMKAVCLELVCDAFEFIIIWIIPMS